MATVHMSEAEVARDLHEVLAKVQQGVEVVIEQDHRPVAVIKPSKAVGRMISEIVAELKERGSTAVMDDDFAHDIEEGIKAQRQPWNPPSWDFRLRIRSGDSRLQRADRSREAPIDGCTSC